MTGSDLLGAVLSGYALPREGIHGITHWARVLENGRRLAAATGAVLEVVELFAILHDSRRRNESIDPGHGRRAAAFARSLRGSAIPLGDRGLDLLCEACAGHTRGRTEADVTVQTCWDADRLDLGRVGIRPRPERLCTPAARDPALLAWADGRARVRFAPALIAEEWGLAPPALPEVP